MNDEKMDAFWSSIGFMLSGIYRDKKAYEGYKKNGEILEYSSLEEMEIVAILEEIGYSLETAGTYLYKSLIISVLNYLKGNAVRLEVLDEEELQRQLNEPYSQLYFDIARNELDLGVKTFHESIANASLKVLENNADGELVGKIFTGKFDPKMYGINALMIAKYYANLRGFIKSEQNLRRTKNS